MQKLTTPEQTTTRLFGVRHGVTKLSAEDCFAGAVDVDLSAEGMTQASKLAERLADDQISAVYCSPMTRTVQTASILAQPHKLSLVLRDGLREINHGHWEGKRRADVETEFANRDKFMMNTRLKTILIVEDELLIALAHKNLLEKNNYIVHLAHSGEKAIEVITTQTHALDLILLDINLGHGMDGFETALQIKQLSSVPLIFCSGHTDQETIEQARSITDYGYIHKTSAPSTLLSTISTIFK